MSITANILKSSSFLILLRFVQRGIGFVSTLILARLLTPQDFGIVAIAVTILYFFDAMSSLGSEQYIVQKTHVSNEDLNTAWTVEIVFKIIFFFLLIISVPIITDYYKNNELANILYSISSILIIGAFKNPGMYLLKKEFKYKSIFWLSLLQKTISFSIVIFITVIKPSYWAIIIGDIVSSFVLTIGSYMIHNFRPKVSIKKIKEQWAFSKWIIVRGVLGYTRSQIDLFLVSSQFNTKELGGYHLVRGLSVMPSTDIIAPAIEPLLAAFALTKQDHKRFAYQVRVSLLFIVIVALPISCFIWFFPIPIIETILGDQWIKTYPILSALSVLFFFITLGQVLNQSCVAFGKVKSLFFYEIISFVFIAGVLFLIVGVDLYEFSLVRGILAGITTCSLFVYVAMLIPLNVKYVIVLAIPTILSSAVSVLIVYQFINIDFIYPVVKLITLFLVYNLSYLLSIWLFYQIHYKNTAEWFHIKHYFSKIILRRH